MNRLVLVLALGLGSTVPAAAQTSIVPETGGGPTVSGPLGGTSQGPAEFFQQTFGVTPAVGAFSLRLPELKSLDVAPLSAADGKAAAASSSGLRSSASEARGVPLEVSGQAGSKAAGRSSAAVVVLRSAQAPALLRAAEAGSPTASPDKARPGPAGPMGLESAVLEGGHRFDGSAFGGRVLSEAAEAGVELRDAPAALPSASYARPVLQFSGRSGFGLSANEPPAPAPKTFQSKWTAWSKRLTDTANLFFVPLNLVQVLKNWIILSPSLFPLWLFTALGVDAAKTGAAHLALNWSGYTSGTYGNLLLMVFGLSTRADGWARVQAFGFATGAMVVTQIYLAGHMPASAFWGLAALAAVLVGVSLYDRFVGLKGGLKKGWTKAAFAGSLAATGLFMYAPLGILWSIFHDPAAAAAVSSISVILGMLGNLVMLPEALRSKNLIWFFGSFYGALVFGVAIIASLFHFGAVSALTFGAVALGVPAYLVFVARMTKKHFGLRSLRDFSFKKSPQDPA